MTSASFGMEPLRREPAPRQGRAHNTSSQVTIIAGVLIANEQPDDPDLEGFRCLNEVGRAVRDEQRAGSQHAAIQAMPR